MDLLDRIRATVRRHDLARPDTRVLAAVSGGPDSVALCWLLRDLHQAGDLRFVGVAHLNHRLRPDAAQDEAFCSALASELGVPFEAGAADVRALAARDGISIEAAAHLVRHRFLRDAADGMGAERVALGHTLDDQAETVLLRLLRGAGLKGLAGMHPRNGVFVRPLIDVRRAALRDLLESTGRPFRLDPTNADRTIPRNRIRADLLPWLAREFNPRIAEVLAVEAELAREDWRFVDDAARQLIREAAVQAGDAWRVEAAAVAAAPKAVGRAALRLLMEQLAGGRPTGLQHVEGALQLCRRPGGAIDLPGHRVERLDGAVVLTSRRAKRGRESGGSTGGEAFEYELDIPGEVAVPEAFCTVSAQPRESAAGLEGSVGGRGETAVVDPCRLEGPFRVRSRRPGDRLTLPGLRGRKKLQDLFVDRKVPRGRRDRVPLVVDRHDRIVWVPEHAVASEFRVTDPAQAVIILRLKVWGGSA
ncbi:MAG: tRNA lysidine(34) synthetase TilS [Vicinamibacterales bacterium]